MGAIQFECQRFLMRFGKQSGKNKAYTNNLKELNDMFNIAVPGNEDKVRLQS